MDSVYPKAAIVANRGIFFCSNSFSQISLLIGGSEIHFPPFDFPAKQGCLKNEYAGSNLAKQKDLNPFRAKSFRRILWSNANHVLSLPSFLLVGKSRHRQFTAFVSIGQIYSCNAVSYVLYSQSECE